jgi:hypothetical protein
MGVSEAPGRFFLALIKRDKNPGLRGCDNWGGQIFTYSCSAQLISFEIDFFYSLWTWIYEYLPPPPPNYRYSGASGECLHGLLAFLQKDGKFWICNKNNPNGVVNSFALIKIASCRKRLLQCGERMDQFIRCVILTKDQQEWNSSKTLVNWTLEGSFLFVATARTHVISGSGVTDMSYQNQSAETDWMLAYGKSKFWRTAAQTIEKSRAIFLNGN